MNARFAPTVLAGLATSGLAAIGGSRTWVEIPEAARAHSSVAVGAPIGEVPLVGALALVVLACWGVVLVTRGRVRKVVAGLGAVTSLGVVASAVVGVNGVLDEARRALSERGLSEADVSRNVWGWVTIAVAVAAFVVCLMALRSMDGWPEMGRKYDAPTAPGTAAVSAGASEGAVTDTSNLDLWKSFDEGLDPTASEVPQDLGGVGRDAPPTSTSDPDPGP